MPSTSTGCHLFFIRLDIKMQIYLDNSATTKICKEALDVYTRVSLESFGNPSSLHNIGQSAEEEIKRAREAVLASVGMRDGLVIFTSSGSEANNLAITGRAMAKDRYKRGAKLITSSGEHASVAEPMRHLEKDGFKIAEISTRGGTFDLSELEDELTADTVLVSVMMVNNETGAVYDIPKISKLVHSKCPDALVHVDATQGYMKIPFTKSAIGADMITLSSHKIEGPKGVGALVIDREVVKSRGLSPIIFGGGQEMGYRSGTENVPGIAAFGEAVRIGMREQRARIAYVGELREYLVDQIAVRDGLRELSPTLPAEHSPHILNVTLPSIKSETMLHFLSSRGIFVSSGSACSSNTHHTSSALIAYGRTEAEADTSIRISLSHRNTKEELDVFLSELALGLSTLSRIRR